MGVNSVSLQSDDSQAASKHVIGSNSDADNSSMSQYIQSFYDMSYR